MAQQAKAAAADVKNTFFSGGPGTTGREVFEDSTASGPGANFRGSNNTSTGTGNLTSGTGTGHGSSGTTGHGTFGTSDGVGSAGTTGYQSTGAGNTSSGQYGPVSAVGAGTAGDATAHHHHHHHGHHGHHGGETGLGTAAVGATGTTAATQQESARGPTAGDVPASAGGGTTGGFTGGNTASTDKTGSLGQNSHLYERTGNQGPLTTGAAGTDRFDTDKPSTGGSGVTGAGSGYGTGPYRVPEGEAGSAEKKSGGIMGVLATSDKDFTSNSDRLGSGAYADTHGHFQMNQSGPGGNTALTGREGNVANNPVAQAQSAGDGSANRGSMDEPGSPKKKGFMEKVKEALT